MSLRNYTAMRIRQAKEEAANPTPVHDFVLDERYSAALLRIKCKDCGKHVLNTKVHNRLPQAELDRISRRAGALWYPADTKAVS